MIKILFITSSRLGDAVISLSVLEALTQQFPTARFTIACGAEVVSLFKTVSNIDRIIPIHKKSYNRHWYFLWCKCFPTKWFLTVDLRGSILSFFLRASQRKILIGKKFQKQRAIAQLKKMSLPLETMPRINPSFKMQEKAKKRMFSPPYVALAPTAGSPQKCWPIENFIQLGNFLKRKGFNLVIFYGAREEEKRAVSSFFKMHPDTLDFGGGEDLEFVSACLQNCALFVGNDSGLMHLSAAIGIPTLGIFGPSLSIKYAPRGEKAYFMEAPGFSGKGVMSLLSVERVQEFILIMLENLKNDKGI
ncbi:glycosyltransferase family 9 protein [Acetobacteraceae bacterium]|nr:glycosyltransferase family 9 protein [Acetobacteraceae bacterium]